MNKILRIPFAFIIFLALIFSACGKDLRGQTESTQTVSPSVKVELTAPVFRPDLIPRGKLILVEFFSGL